MGFSEAPKFATRLVGNCVKQLVIHKLIREATKEDMRRNRLFAGIKGML